MSDTRLKPTGRVGSEPTHRVSVLIPTFQDAYLLQKSLPVLLGHPPAELEVLVLNNDESQDVRSAIGRYGRDPRVRIIEMGVDSGVVRALNRGIRESSSALVMFCNADLFPTTTYLGEMLRFLDEHQRAGAAMGKLVRYDLANDRPTDVIDTAGLLLTRQRRLMPRGEGERDIGQFEGSVEVFGVDGAAVVIRRAALDDIRVDDEYLDENFVWHKDDHDLSWRLRLAGWECWYCASAIAYHGRTTRGLGSKRYFSEIRGFHRNEQEKSRLVRMHAMKNQWLLLLKNEDRYNFLRDFPFILGREAMVMTHNLLFSPRSLVAIPMTLRAYRGTMKKRRSAKARQKMDPRALRRWLRTHRNGGWDPADPITGARPETETSTVSQPDLRELEPVLRCPDCGGRVEFRRDEITCLKCSASFPIIDGVPMLVRRGSVIDEHKVQQASFWDQADAEWEIERPTSAPRLYCWALEHKFDRSIAGIHEILPGATVLVVCGGSGMDAEFLAAHSGTVITADISLESAKRARVRAARHRFDLISIVADAEALPFASQVIDVVFVHDGLHHLEDPNPGISEMLRVARSAVSINEPADAFATKVASRIGLSEAVEEAGNRVARVNARDVVQHLDDAGFQPVMVSRSAVMYRHVPGRISRLLSHEPLFFVSRSFYGMLNWLIGRAGNKLTVQAIRKQ